MWFKRWIVEGYTVGQLARQSGHSRATIGRIIHYWLEHPPERISDGSRSKHLIFDGTFLKRRKGMYVAMNGESHEVVYGEYGTNEGPRDLLKFCETLKSHGVEPRSATIDGNPHIFRALQLVWPDILIQRCLVHVQRQGLSWCRQHPKRTDAKRLRDILLTVLDIHSQYQRRRFERTFDKWNEQYGLRLSSTPNRGWVTSDLQRARSMVMRAMPFMFTFLVDPNIPRSTNALEGYFSRLKQRYRRHRGLSKRNRANFFQWYFYLCPR